MYWLLAKSTVNAPTIEALNNKKEVKKRFFFELDSIDIWGITNPEFDWNPTMSTDALRKEYERSPVVAINKFLSCITDPEKRTLKRNYIYKIKPPC